MGRPITINFPYQIGLRDVANTQSVTTPGMGGYPLILVNNPFPFAPLATKLAFVSVQDLTNNVFTITGTDINGNPITEQLAGSNNSVQVSQNRYKSVISIVSNIPVTGPSTIAVATAPNVALAQTSTQLVNGSYPITLLTPTITFPGVQCTLQIITGNETGNTTFTVTGTDLFNNSIIAQVTVAPNFTGLVNEQFHTITSITASSPVTSSVWIQSGDQGTMQWISFDNNRTIFQASAQITVTGTIDYSVQYTNQPLQLRNYPLNNTIYNETPSASSTLIYLDNENYKVIQNETSSVFYQLNIPVQAMQVVVNSGLTTGTLSVNVIQQGI